MTPMIKAVAAGALLLVATLAPAGTRVYAGRHAASTPASDGPLRAFVSPHFGREPAIVRIDAFVEPGAGNRALEVVVDSSTYYRRSTIELHGADAPRSHQVVFRSVPSGAHDVRVTLTGTSGAVRAIVHDRVVIYE